MGVKRSGELFGRANRVIPGGVNSPVRACRSVGTDPVFVSRAKGGSLWTADGDRLVDFVMSWGPMLLGHAHPEVEEAAVKALRDGASFGAPCEAEVLMAEEVVKAMPNVEMVRMVNSGTEATMSALRLARGFTGRDKVVKFTGCYHGHNDCFLAAAGSGLATLSIPGTPGVPADVVAHTLLAPYNDLAAVEELFASDGKDIACVIVEPVAGNMGLVLPEEGFLRGLGDLCAKNGALLIFDEVITGFRVALGGASSRFGIDPDLVCLGKIIGGGFPVGAYGGKREIMERIAPCGDVYQAGTLSGNPVAMAAGLATLRALAKCDYEALEQRTLAFADKLVEILTDKGLAVRLNHVASMFTIFFAVDHVRDFESAKKSDGQAYAAWYSAMRAGGVNLAPSGYECAFLSFAHTDEELEMALEAARKAEVGR